jgi:ribosomal protein S6
MKRYEGLFILDLAGKEDGIKEVVDKVTAEITSAGGRIETIQKMDKKPFAREARSGQSAGHYVNVIFEAKTSVVSELSNRFKHATDVVRVLFTEAPKVVAKA